MGIIGAKRGQPGWLALALALTCGIESAPGKAATNPPPKVMVQSTPVKRDARAPMSFSPVARKVGPSVVNIYSTMMVRERPNPWNDPIWRRFFGEDSDGPRAQLRERREPALGSGVIVSADGYVLTANHVIEGADRVKVALNDGEKEYDAKVIGADPPTDLAVLKIEASQALPAIVLGDSDQMEVGDLVLAVGNPFGVGQTLTMGIVSGLGRGLGVTGYESFIQTDAAINPGNSGGALLDVEGRLVGINTIIMSRSGGFQGMGFAVPINIARFVMDRLITTGRVARGYLGINIQPLTPELAKEFDLPDDSSGVLIGGVVANGAAAEAGVKSGDVVLEFNGRKVSDPQGFRLLVAETLPGTQVKLRLLRGEPGRKPTQKTVSATLAELPSNLFSARAGRGNLEEEKPANMDALDGVEVTDIDAAMRRQYDLPRDLRGALVITVEPASTAAAAGLTPGTVIIEINRHAVQNADDAVRLSTGAKGDRVLLRVWSGGPGPGGTRYIVVENSKRR